MAVLVLSCGGGSDRPSKSAYITRADRICADNAKQVAAVARPQQLNELPAYVTKLSKVTRAELSKLRALERPSGDDKRLESYYDAIEESVDKAQDAAEAAKKNDSPGTQKAITDAGKVSERANAEARKYGFKQCGRRGTG